ncbi:Glucan endo-1 like protein [Verticillium longisporum]|uniref:Glucan endo-1 like protein n=1 Tax=Verticillium longisporum TaxID=100787 RepID=A0A8I2ZXN8_VERLO|nr:Glucan endo-1 like protein [Verticillium longisporum]RBQ89659.1 hypothetical protein VDGD_02082 [Verticillium dahliae]
MRFALLPTVLAVLPLAAAWTAPTYGGFEQLWSEEFTGSAGDRVDSKTWNYMTDIHVNNELQKYTEDTRNVQISGGGTVQLVPWRDARGQWTSGRIESKYVFTPRAGRVTLAEATLRFGANGAATRQGLWPAFWMLGDAMRHGVDWPACGEIDILERVNGAAEVTGTVHCDREGGGGACNTPTGIGAPTALPDGDWHAWRLEFDRTAPDWRVQTITWFRDGQQFHQVSGERIGSEGIWKALCQSPVYFILNVAVGGTLPGNPNDQTLGGYGAMMEVAYVAVYRSQDLG